MLFDPHCHLDLPAFDADRDAVVDRARAAGIEGFMVAGVDEAGWRRQRALAQRCSGVAWSAGLHPVWVAEGADVEHALATLPAQFEGATPAIAVGETGLDRRRAYRSTQAAQEAAFRAHLAFARARDLPVILHVVAAHGRTLEILNRDGLPARGGVMHAWSGSAELVPAFVALGMHISFAGPVAHPNARRQHAAVRVVPAERLWVETDAPDLPPPGVSRNEPAALGHIAAAVARLRGETAAEVLARSSANARRLFGLD